jgi:hypothetical protein
MLRLGKEFNEGLIISYRKRVSRSKLAEYPCEAMSVRVERLHNIPHPPMQHDVADELQGWAAFPFLAFGQGTQSICEKLGSMRSQTGED